MFCRWDNRPIDDAKSYDHKEIVELLTKYMSNTSQSDEWTWTVKMLVPIQNGASNKYGL